MTLGATPFSIYQTFTPAQIAFVVGDAGAKVAIVEEAYLETLREARAELPELETVIVVDTQPTSSAGTGGGAGADTVAGTTSRAPIRASIAEPHWRAVDPGRPRHADLHLGHDRAAQGRAAHAPQPRWRRVRAADEIIRFPDGSRVISWLPAAHIAERMAHHYLPIVFAMTVTTLPEPARDRRPTCRRSSRPGSSPCRGSSRSSRAGSRGTSPRRASRPSAGCTAARRKVELEQAGEPVPDDVAATAAGGRGEAVPRAARDARARRGDRGQRRRGADAARRARLLPRDRRPARRAVGHVGDLRGRRGQPARRDQDRHRRARRPRASSSSWPTTASCWSAATS